MTLQPVLIIGGPTASGKSGMAVSIASLLSGIVINGDSMQIYQGLPILTAQPEQEDAARAPHRLYAALSPDDACSAARWRDMALTEIAGAHAGRKLPVIVGGTGLYLKTLLKGISPVPDIPHEFRDKATALQKELGNPGFHRALALRDPDTASRLDPLNTQRLVRAWEVLDATGKGLAHWQSAPPVPPPAHLRFVTVTLLPPRVKLYAACDARFERMLERGVLEEVRQFKNTRSALAKALGYADLSAHLEGKTSLAAAVAAAQQATRRYAKRQVTWFRHQTAADLTFETPDLKSGDFDRLKVCLQGSGYL